MTLLELKNSPAVIEHVRMLHTKMRRMANYSLLCKVCCVLLLIAVAGLAMMHFHIYLENFTWFRRDDPSYYDKVERFVWRLIPYYYNICVKVTIALFLIDSYFVGIRRRTQRACNDFVERLKTAGEAVSEELLLSEPAKPRKDKMHEAQTPEDLLSHLTNTKTYESADYHKAESSAPRLPSLLSRLRDKLTQQRPMLVDTLKSMISPSAILFYGIMLWVLILCHQTL